jgi:hypothetical protein
MSQEAARGNRVPDTTGDHLGTPLPYWTTEGRLIRDRLQSVRSGRFGRMSDLAYFEYATVIPPVGNQREGTPAHYLVEVLISDPVTHKERGEAELKRMANDFLALALNRGVNPIPGLSAISELDAEKLKKVGSAGIHHDGGVSLVE